MKIFKRKSASSAEGHSVDAERLLAVVNRGRSESYPLFEPAAPELVERRFWAPDPISAATA